MATHIDDLPKALRERIAREHPEVRVAQSRSRSGRAEAGGASRLRCATCGDEFSSYPSSEKHDPSHHRIEVVLDEVRP